jgi:hypothetical protein
VSGQRSPRPLSVTGADVDQASGAALTMHPVSCGPGTRPEATGCVGSPQGWPNPRLPGRFTTALLMQSVRAFPWGPLVARPGPFAPASLLPSRELLPESYAVDMLRTTSYKTLLRKRRGLRSAPISIDRRELGVQLRAAMLILARRCLARSSIPLTLSGFTHSRSAI